MPAGRVLPFLAKRLGFSPVIALTDVPRINFHYKSERALWRLRTFAEFLHPLQRVGQGYIGIAKTQRPISLSARLSMQRARSDIKSRHSPNILRRSACRVSEHCERTDLLHTRGCWRSHLKPQGMIRWIKAFLTGLAKPIATFDRDLSEDRVERAFSLVFLHQ